ncbi:MAG: hypothetical protein ABIQ03_04325 [Burkholderiales bacterium]
MEFVTFHVALGSDDAVHPNQTLKHNEYLSMIHMMFASARLFHPGAKAIVLTDTDTNFAYSARNVDQVVRCDMDRDKLMLERAKAQWRYVRNNPFESPIIILDSDILINAPLFPIFGNEFDIAVTWRESTNMPINGGFLILNNDRPEIAKRFFERFTEIYQDRYADKAAWFGDQLALRDCVGLSLLDMAKYNVVDVNGCRILLLPCDTYNYSPMNQYGEICSDLSEKVVLHFKGERKRLMAPFWRGWLRQRGSYLPWIRLIGWRERRWLRQQSEIEERVPEFSEDGEL